MERLRTVEYTKGAAVGPERQTADQSAWSDGGRELVGVLAQACEVPSVGRGFGKAYGTQASTSGCHHSSGSSLIGLGKTGPVARDRRAASRALTLHDRRASSATRAAAASRVSRWRTTVSATSRLGSSATPRPLSLA